MGRNLWNEIQKVINIHIEQIHFLPVSKAAILNVIFKENDEKKPMHNDDNIYRQFLLILSLSLFFTRSLFIHRIYWSALLVLSVINLNTTLFILYLFILSTVYIPMFVSHTAHCTPAWQHVLEQAMSLVWKWMK